MKSANPRSRLHWLCLAVLMGITSNLLDGSANAQNLQTSGRQLTLEQRTNISYDAYILGPGDTLQIELQDLPELSGAFTIGPDGTLYIPRLRSLYVEGLTIEEIRNFLTIEFSKFVIDPEIYIRPISYRPVRVYVGGEVKRPGFYTIGGPTNLTRLSETAEKEQLLNKSDSGEQVKGLSIDSNSSNLRTFSTIFPTVFDAIRTASGITPFSDLSKVQVIRKRAQSLGGGRIKTDLNFLSFIMNGDNSHNIRLYDGDVLNITKSSEALRDQLLKAGQTNLNPQFMRVFVLGRVNLPGEVILPQGSTLNQAISMAGGTKPIRGKVEFVRFEQEGTLDRRIFPYKSNAEPNTLKNPILASGDLIRINDSIVSSSIGVLNELTQPFVGLYTVYNLFNN